MWLASLMSSGLLAEADDARLIKKFICDEGLLDSMLPIEKNGNRKEVEELCGTNQKKKKAVTTATNAGGQTATTGNAGGQTETTGT